MFLLMMTMKRMMMITMNMQNKSSILPQSISTNPKASTDYHVRSQPSKYLLLTCLHHPVVSDLLMSEVISHYARNKEEKSEDSGIESGNTMDNTGRDTFPISFINTTRFLIPGSDSHGESSSEHSVQEEGHGVPGELVEVPGHDKEDLLVCRL